MSLNHMVLMQGEPQIPHEAVCVHDDERHRLRCADSRNLKRINDEINHEMTH